MRYKRENIIVTSGEFDPLDGEGISFLKRCKSRGDWLAIGLHSDWWMKWAMGGVVQDYETRREILSSLKFVDEIFTFDDTDGTVCQLLKIVKYCYPGSNITYISQEDMNDMPERKISGIKFEIMK
jgi:bifunctional ADP-heptose synthase (sugar kinase/adenylyltransferase)